MDPKGSMQKTQNFIKLHESSTYHTMMYLHLSKDFLFILSKKSIKRLQAIFQDPFFFL